jgi:hypothetical protein
MPPHFLDPDVHSFALTVYHCCDCSVFVSTQKIEKVQTQTVVSVVTKRR